MIMTLEHVQILDQTDHLIDMIKQSDVMGEYECALKQLEENEEAQSLIRSFKHIKEHYEDVQRFGRYHPDYQEIMKNVRSSKRKMDMNEYVAKFKLAERNLQTFLDDISESIARSVSDKIIVPKENGLLSDSGCSSGSCGTGGSCGCQAS
ncbi:MAG TPA: YlbF family regulator [Candidatus Pseudogracilibacillus intestinigallinarum]|uniref:YlbF family regulator n=1 Tax=Candidatus Pseudogracilibacillus intestinigallinarum TaxID=2838742 RepID=A0A9D1PKM8_9BACI|nr:YlbF family regulator [Candidatus Pseudogracilibacillus intestinigallinarum]